MIAQLSGERVFLLLPGLALITFTAYNQRLGRARYKGGWEYRKDSPFMFWFGVGCFYATGLLMLLAPFVKK